MDLSKIVVGGPCKITDGGVVYYSEGDVRLEPQPTWRAVPSDVGGEHDDTLVDLVWRINFTPKSVYSYRSTLVPTTYTNWTAAGARIIGPKDQNVTILGTDGRQYIAQRAAPTRMPDIYLGLGKSMWGAVEYTAFIRYQAALTDDDAFFKSSDGQQWAQDDYPTTHQEAMCTASWGVAGLDAMYAEEGFQITHEFRTVPVKQGNVTVDHRIESYRALCAFRPQQPTENQILAVAQFASGTGKGIGSRASHERHDLVISDGGGVGTGLKATLGSMALRTGQFVFDSKMTRLGDWNFVTAATTPISPRLTLGSN